MRSRWPVKQFQENSNQMSKLPAEHAFLDLSDYGRAPARRIELARVKETPSYTGRYFDSVSDIILNFFFLCSISYITQGALLWVVIAFVAMQLQGTLYNYYYVILRNKFDGDKTSRIFEDKPPVALPGEKQSTVDIWFWIYNSCYSAFDKTIYLMDRHAEHGQYYPKWFMTAVSAFGLGFQLLIISVMLCLGLAAYIIAFFIGYSILILVFIALRKYLNRSRTGNELSAVSLGRNSDEF